MNRSDAMGRGATIRLDAAGAIKDSPGKLYWLTINPSAINFVVELTDDTAALGTVVWDAFGSVRLVQHVIFDPPMDFDTGIYAETLTNITSIIAYYE